MTDEPGRLSIVRDFPTVAPDQKVVDAIQALLQLAQQGELRGLIWYGPLRDGGYSLDGAGGYSSLDQIIGALELLKFHIIVMKQPPTNMTIATPKPPEDDA